MLSFERVRINLRGQGALKVILTEADLDSERKQIFPPFVDRATEDVNENMFSEPNWKLMSNVPILLWYPPRRLPKYTKETDLRLLNIKI
jgi:hypothetical protein